ncbi:MAG: DNA polymerase III subunit delta [Flavobacteriales bacterium]
MDHYQVIRDISAKNYKPVYVLMGEEPYFIDVITDHIEEHVLDEASKAFCQSIVYGREVKMPDVISLAKGFPMMGDKQVVIVKEAQEMREWKKAEDLEGLEVYLKNPTPSTMLVFTYKHKKLDKRTKLYKLMDKVGVVFDSEKIKDYKLPEWITKYTEQRGYKIQNNAAILLADYLGTDLSKVVNAVNKLAVILPAGSQITTQHIEDNIGISKDYNVFELIKALNVKDVLKSNRIINYFEANPKANPIQMTIPMLYRHFSQLAAYLGTTDKSQAAKEIGIAPWALNDFKEASKNYDARKAEKIISYLRSTDKKTKGVENVSAEDGDLMKELVFKILH